MTQLMLNSKISNITKETSFFANFDKDSNLFEVERNHKSVQSVMKRIEILKRVHENIISMQERSAKY